MSRIQTACEMLDKVYEQQYESITAHIRDVIESSANRNEYSCEISVRSWDKDCPVISISDIVEELNTKGYNAEVVDGLLTIDWKGAERLCLKRPYKGNQIAPATTIGEVFKI